jgi:hypothetical protein
MLGGHKSFAVAGSRGYSTATLEMHCAYAQRTDGMFSDNQIRELLVNKL